MKREYLREASHLKSGGVHWKRASKKKGSKARITSPCWWPGRGWGRDEGEDRRSNQAMEALLARERNMDFFLSVIRSHWISFKQIKDTI